MSSTTIAERANFSPLPLPWAARVIERMQALYGAKFAQQWAEVPAKRLVEIWAEELGDLTGDEIARGLKACRQRPFPPTLPEFMVLCRPPIVAEVAFHEAVHGLGQRRKGERGDWSHPAIFHAAVAVGASDMLSCSFGQLRQRWERALNDQLAKGHWEPVPEGRVALPAPGKTAASDREAARSIQQLAADALPPRSVAARRAWPAKILANPAGRTPTVVAMAQKAAQTFGQDVAEGAG